MVLFSTSFIVSGDASPSIVLLRIDSAVPSHISYMARGNGVC